MDGDSVTANPKAAAAAEKVAQAMAATVDPIIQAIEAGLASADQWRAPWHGVDPEAMRPHCPATERDYTAGNRLVLALTSMSTGAATHWGTFKQWQQLDACVQKGQTASARIIRPATAKRLDATTGDEVSRVIGWAAYPVFHAGQVDGYEMPGAAPAAEPADDVEDCAAAIAWARSAGARVELSPSAGASYSPTFDRIQLPDLDRWHDAHGAWSTTAHELTHWTGHTDRLARDMSGRFGDDAYAAEELVAELGAAFSLAAIGRSSEPRPDHAHYLAAWLRVLKADASRLWTAASYAEKAAAYIAERAYFPELVTA